MKSLDQIEHARLSLSALHHQRQRSYYLTANLTVATAMHHHQRRQCDAGPERFTISSTAPSATAPVSSSVRAVRTSLSQRSHPGGVTNFGGVYSGPGFANGIDYSDTAPGTRGCGRFVLAVLIRHSSCRRLFDVVESCTVQMVGANGIVASTIKRSVAVECGIDALNGDQLADCYGKCTGSGSGIRGRTVQNCYGSSATGYGLRASAALNCYGISGSGTGLHATTSARTVTAEAVPHWSVRLHRPELLRKQLGQLRSLGERVAQNCCGYTTGNGGVGLRTSTAQNCYGETLP